jgi:hypothetical protein
MSSRRVGASYTALRRKLLGWPGVEEASHYGKPSLKAFGKFLTRLHEDGDSIVILGIPFDEREMLMETQGEVFHITPHYRSFPSVLMRLSASDPAGVEAMVRRRWVQVAPKKVRAEFDATTGAAAKSRRKAT